MSELPIVYVSEEQDGVHADNELYKEKGKDGIDASYCIYCNSNNQVFLRREGCYCKDACAISNFDSCHFKEEIGEMATQRTVKQHREIQNRKKETRETKKREAEQKIEDDKNKRNKKQDEEILNESEQTIEITN